MRELFYGQLLHRKEMEGPSNTISVTHSVEGRTLLPMNGFGGKTWFWGYLWSLPISFSSKCLSRQCAKPCASFSKPWHIQLCKINIDKGNRKLFESRQPRFLVIPLNTSFFFQFLLFEQLIQLSIFFVHLPKTRHFVYSPLCTSCKTQCLIHSACS